MREKKFNKFVLLSFLSVRDELVVATVDGCLNRLRWTGNKNEKATLHLNDIPVSADLQQFRGLLLLVSFEYNARKEE